MYEIMLGYTVPEGKPFCIPLQHSVFTGMSGISGKTTAEEAIYSRLPQTNPPYRVLVFLTKRGEKTFRNSHNVKPYFKIDFSWEYLEALMASAMREKLKFERAWIIKLAKLTLTEMKVRNAPEESALWIARDILSRMILDRKTREFDRNIYTVLAAYLDKVLPTLRAAMPTWSKELQLQPGINVMDLTPWYTEEEIQMLVIRSCMEHILKEENNVIVCLPEAWKLLPEQRNTPVKLYFEKYIREGATNGNYLNLDAQDLGGLSKAPLRQVSVWIMGRMQESNEVERLLKQMLGVDIASRAIQTLPLGHFMVAAGDKVVKVYVLPKGVPPEMGIAVAKGEKTAEEVKQWLINLNSLEASVATGKESPAIPEEIKEITPVETTPVEEPIVTFNTDELSKDKGTGSPEETADKPGYGSDPRDTIRKSLGIDKLEERLAKVEASLLLEKMGTTTAQLYQTKRIVKVTPAEKTVNLNTDNHAGKVMWLAKKGFLKSWHSLAEVEKELSEYGWNIPRVNLGNTLKDLVEKGYVGTRKTDRTQYRLAEFVEIQ